MPLFRHATPATNLAELAINRLQRSQLDRFFRLLVSFTGTEGRELRRLAIIGLVMGGALVAFFAVLEDVLTRDPLVRVDDAVFHLLQSLRTASLDRAMVVTTELGDWVVTTAVTLAALIWLLWRHKQRTALYFCATVVASGAFSFLLKFTLRVARPVHPTSGWDTFSFPSGHATINATLYGFLAVLIAREVQSWKRGCVVTVAITIILSIALSRLYLGAHFLSDVLAGLCLSVVWITLVSAVYLQHKPTDVGAGGLSVAVVITIILVGGLHIRHRYPQDAARYASHIATRLGHSRSPGNWSNSWLLRETIGDEGEAVVEGRTRPAPPSSMFPLSYALEVGRGGIHLRTRHFGTTPAMNMESDMTEFSEWIQPLAEGQVAFDELAGKSLARFRYCPKDAYSDLFDGTGHFFEFQFTDGSIFRIDSDRGFRAQ